MNYNQNYGQYQTPNHAGYGYGYARGDSNARAGGRGNGGAGRGEALEGVSAGGEAVYPPSDLSHRGVPHEQGQREQMTNPYGQQPYMPTAHPYSAPNGYSSAVYAAQQPTYYTQSSPSPAFPSSSQQPMVVIPRQNVVQPNTRMLPQSPGSYHLQHVHPVAAPQPSHFRYSNSPVQPYQAAWPQSPAQPSPRLSIQSHPSPRVPNQPQPSPQLSAQPIHSPRVATQAHHVSRIPHSAQHSPQLLAQPRPQPSPQLNSQSPRTSNHPEQSPRIQNQPQPLPRLQSHFQPQVPQSSWSNHPEQHVHEPLQTPQHVTHVQQHLPITSSSPQSIPQSVSRPQVMVEIPAAASHLANNSSPRTIPPQKPTQATSSTNHHATSTPSIKKPPPPSPSVDYQQLLLLLAEDYINAAHAMGALAAFYRRSGDLKQYFHLMGTALGCIEASLTEFRLLPQAEAMLTLQYANLLFHETENYGVVEEFLSKTIPLCERNKLLDLKYSMQHLSARTLFMTKPRVAIKSLDTLIPNVHAYRHVPWIYALRFLRVSFVLRADAGHHDLTIAIQNLNAISEIAAGENDAAVAVVCATFEALLQLRSMNANCVEEAQRAIAKAKQYQLHPLVKSLIPLWALVDCIDLVCYLMQYTPETAVVKVTKLAPLVEQLKEAWKEQEDGVLLIPLEGIPGSLTDNTSGIFRRIDGKDHLTFSWLHKRDLWTLCFLLSSSALQMKNPTDPKVETYLREGLKIIKENFRDNSLSRDDINSSPASFCSAARRMEWWCNLEWYFNLHLAVCFSNRGTWARSQEHLDAAQECPAVSSLNKVNTRAKWETYLQGMIYQGTGRIEEALSIFQSPILELPQGTHRVYDAETDLCVLAVLNSILIILDPSHPQHFNAQLLHACVEPFIHNHPNKSLYAAHSLIKSILNPTQKLTEKKQYLMACFNAVRNLNSQLTCIALSLMYTVFFKDVLGEQSRKSAMSARQLAEKAGMPLWRGVTAGLVETTERSHGHIKEADRAVLETEKWIDSLPEAVKCQFTIADDSNVSVKVEE